MARAPLFWQPFSSLSWDSKLQRGTGLQSPSTAAQLINTNPRSLVITMKAAGWMVEVWLCSFLSPLEQGMQSPAKAQSRYSGTPYATSVSAGRGHPREPWGLTALPMKNECRQLLYHQFSSYLTKCWFPHINRPLVALQSLLALKMFASQL